MLSIVDAVDEYVALLHDERLPDGKIHPSSAWGCARRAVYELRGVAPSNPHSAATRRRFRIGHILHEFVTAALATSPDVLSCHAEFEILSDAEAGSGDALVELEDGTWIVVEAKSSRDPHPKLDARHAWQGRHYGVHARARGVRTLDGWLAPLGEAMAGVLVVYLGKTSLDITEYWLPYDVAWEGEVDERLAYLGRYRDDPRSLPPRQASAKSAKSRECYGCEFVDRCWMADPPLVEPVGRDSLRAG